MKTTKLKGFTLIELIVVMAIFGIIMFGAMSMIAPASKVMIQSETYENGNAAVTSVTNYLEKSLASAEVLDIYNYVPEGGNTQEIAKKFVENHYPGLLKDTTSPDLTGSINYADGRVHIMVIDNSGVDNSGAGNTVIQEYTYEISDFHNPSPVLISSEPSAVNKAYYDSYDLQIRVGTFEDETGDWLNPLSDLDFRKSLAADNTAFTVRAQTHQMINGKTYSFMRNTIFNIAVNSSFDFYYQIRDEGSGDQIKQIAAPSTNPTIDNPPTGDVFETYCFVYSYGAEIYTH